MEYSKHILPNGLRVLIHVDKNTPMVAVNTLFDVGARDEDPNRTGFAHLFEHLMFGGSINIPEFDSPLQLAGGESNAFTSNDITNYYNTLPAANLDTALWLESDRMLSLAFTDKSLEVQRSVVIEEFKQRYINQPYGDVWHLIRKEAYKNHPYQWPTIGKDLSHIEEAQMQEVKDFFYKHYGPSNAILCVAGNIDPEYALERIQFWYKDVPQREPYVRSLLKEEEQKEKRLIKHQAQVPANALYMAFKMPGRFDQDYAACDLITDMLSRGMGSHFQKVLVKEKQLFSDASCYVLGAYDQGLMVASGRLKNGVDFEDAEKAVWEVIEHFKVHVTEEELQKVKNKFESARLYSDTNVLNRAMNLCFHELNGSAEDYIKELEHYMSLKLEDIQRVAKSVFDDNQYTSLHYQKSQE